MDIFIFIFCCNKKQSLSYILASLLMTYSLGGKINIKKKIECSKSHRRSSLKPMLLAVQCNVSTFCDDLGCLLLV